MKILKVPYVTQKNSKACFPAGIRMALKYFGTDLSEAYLYQQGKWWRGTSDAALAIPLLQRGFRVITHFNWERWVKLFPDKRAVQTYKRQYRFAKRLGLEHVQSATTRQIENYIDKGIPVLTEIACNVFYKMKTEASHVLVIVGYDDYNFYYHDPSPYHGGKNLKASWTMLKKAWRGLPYALPNLYVITPKVQNKSKANVPETTG